ncbi:CoA-transferase [Nocardioides humi]|uniref:CoA-transferase subunit beta n=1 Tax=Nocardioides humi TaxID=449461 RepID=A0ABN2AD08_9ACTN|nr:CoA-transferase [Nocardioides humi]
MNTTALDAPASRLEVMATVIAHDLEDGEWVEVGANLPVPRAGALLAHLTRGPNMTVMLAMTKAYLVDEPVIEDFAFITDVGAMRWAEAYYQHDQLLNQQRHRAHGVFYCGGIQIDAYGNSNLIGIGDDYRRLRFRGPGPIGTCNATVQSGRWHLVTTSHTPRVLVEQVDFISAVGYGRGEPDLRASLGLQNPGPSSIITPLCVFDFGPEDRRARLKSLHPGVSLQEVVDSTGFAFEHDEAVATTPAPSAEELHTLRTRIDAHGDLR